MALQSGSADNPVTVDGSGCKWTNTNLPAMYIPTSQKRNRLDRHPSESRISGTSYAIGTYLITLLHRKRVLLLFVPHGLGKDVPRCNFHISPGTILIRLGLEKWSRVMNTRRTVATLTLLVFVCLLFLVIAEQAYAQEGESGGLGGIFEKKKDSDKQGATGFQAFLGIGSIFVMIAVVKWL